MVELQGSAIDSVPNVGNDASSRYIQGVATRDEGLLIIIDLNKLLAEDKRSEEAIL